MSQQSNMESSNIDQHITGLNNNASYPQEHNLMNNNNSTRLPMLLVLFINIVIVFLVYGIFLQLKFTVDTYSHIYLSGESFFSAHMSMGRPFAAIITQAMQRIGIVDGIHQIPYVLVLIISISICSTVLFIKLDETIRCNSVSEYVLTEIAALIPFINVFFVSWFMYTEASILMGLGAVLAVFSAYCTTHGTIRNKILGFIFLVLSISLYQAYMEMYVALSCLFILLKHKIRFSGSCVKEIVVTLVIAVLGIIANMLMTSLICRAMNIVLSNRTASFDIANIANNIRKIAAFQSLLWIKGVQMLPEYTLLLFAVMLIGILIVASIQSKQYDSLTISMWAAIIVGLYILVFSPHIVSPVFWPAERTLFPLFSIFGIIIALIVLIKPNKVILAITSVICVCFVVVNIVEIQDIASDQQITNALDQEYAMMIDERIREYEGTTGNKISYLGIVEDTAPTYGYYPQVDKIIYDTNISAKSHEWCYYPMLKYYTHRDFELVDVPVDIYDTYFAEKNWDCFIPDEQIVFNGETVYICGY